MINLVKNVVSQHQNPKNGSNCTQISDFISLVSENNDVILNENSLLVGVEIKLAASVSESDFKGLKRFKTQYPERFVGGYVLYDGERTLSFGDELYAVPLQSLWLS